MCPFHDVQEFINIFSRIFVKIVKPVKNMFDLSWIHKHLVRPGIFFFVYVRVGRTRASRVCHIFIQVLIRRSDFVRSKIKDSVDIDVLRNPGSDSENPIILMSKLRPNSCPCPSNSDQCHLLWFYVVRQDSSQFFANRYHSKLVMKSDDPINLEISWSLLTRI